MLALKDGWVLKSSENSNLGGSKDNTATVIRLGDDASNRQYRAVLSFNTASLPDGATIQSALLKINQSGAPVGSNPFNVLGTLWADIRKGPFSGVATLQVGDFNAPASINKVGYFSNTPVSGWYNNTLDANGRNNINKLGVTQLRLYFAKDDNNDHGADYMKFLSGNSSSGKPILTITYIVP